MFVFTTYLNLVTGFVIFFDFLATKEAEKTLKLSKKLINDTNDETKTLMMISFSMFVERNIPKFSCGLFDFDLKLVGGVSCAFF